MPDSTTLLDLAAPRRIVFSDRQRKFTVTCRRILKEDWLAYFGAIRVTSEHTPEGMANTSDYNSAALLLAERVITGCEGYTVAGGADLAQLPNWQARLPIAHRFQVGVTLADVHESAPSDAFEIQPEGDAISLDAVWGADDTGRMQQFTGLKHLFKTPTAAQHKRYNDAASRSVVVGGSRTGLTIYTGAHATLVDLYDELILSVDGYRVNYDLLEDRKAIAANMDTFHKFAAARALFNPSSSTLLDFKPAEETTQE
jgi:hypothetical protein